MTGYAGRISFEGDASLATELTDVAIKYANTLAAWKQTQGIPNVVRAFDLGDGRYCVVTDLQNMRSLHVVSPVSDPIHYNIPTFEVPRYPGTAGVVDVVSGRVVNSELINEEITINGETKTVPAIKSFTPTDKTADRYTDLERRRRLGVQEDGIFTDFLDESGKTWTEHRHVKPAMYSGAMRKVVQLLLGVGFILRPTYEEKRMSYLKKPLVTTQQVGEGVHSAFGLYETDQTKATPYISMKFDYRHGKTHGVCFGTDDKPWVVEVSTRGVHVMPLYMDPVSQTTAGRKQYVEISPELKDFFEEFDGFPLGVTMPTGKTFTQMKNAGEIVQLVSSEAMQEYYQYSAYTGDHGWSFNPRGSEAHHTCYGYDNGIGVGYHYMVNIKVGTETLPDLNGDMASIVAALQLTNIWEINKTRRMSEAQLDRVLREIDLNPENARKFFDDLEVTPTLVASGNLKMLRKGWLYHPAKPKFQPQIKFPVAMFNGVVSHDFGRLEGSTAPTKIVCNTPMFVAHVSGRLEVVYYYYDTNIRSKPGYSTRQQCQYVGSWEDVAAEVDAHVWGNFYSTTFDWREVGGQTRSWTKTSSEEIFRYNYAACGPGVFAQCIDVVKILVFWFDTEHHTQNGRNGVISVAMPVNDRSCYYMAQYSYAIENPVVYGGHHETALGGSVDVYGIYDFICHWAANFCADGGPFTHQARLIGSHEVVGSCFPDVAPDFMNYSCESTQHSSSTGMYWTINAQGPWGSSFIGSASWPAYQLPSAWSRPEGEYVAHIAYKLFMLNDSGHGALKLKSGNMDVPMATLQGDIQTEVPLSSWWWTVSPDDNGNFAPLFEVHSCLGENVMAYMDDIAGDTKTIGNPDMAGYWNTCHTGVIE